MLQELSEKSILPQGYPSLFISILIKAGHGLAFFLQWNRLKSFQTGPNFLIRTSSCQICSPSLLSLQVTFPLLRQRVTKLTYTCEQD